MKDLAEKRCDELLRKDLIKRVRCSKRAEYSDEKYYQRLYRERYKKFCQGETIREEISELKEDLLKKGENLENYDFEGVKRGLFAIVFHCRLKIVLRLPKYILQEVADVRVFALGLVSKKVKKILKDYYKTLCLIEKMREREER